MHWPEQSELPPAPKGENGWPWRAESSIRPEKMPDGGQWPKISIVTPSYNQGQFIEETIRSVLLQNYPSLEYIIIDGGSTDNTIEIIKRYESWITYWVSEKDQGQSHAINKGFSMATGEWLGWVNSDDMLAADALRVVVSNGLDGGPDVVAGACEWINTAGNKVLRYPSSYVPATQMLRIWDSKACLSPATQPSIFFRRDLINRLGSLREDLHYIMDWELWLRFRANGAKWKCIENILSYVKRHEAQKTSEANLHKNWREAEMVFRQYSNNNRLVTRWQGFCLRSAYARKGWMHRNYRRSHKEMLLDTIKNPLPLFDPRFYGMLFKAVQKRVRRSE